MLYVGHYGSNHCLLGDRWDKKSEANGQLSHQILLLLREKKTFLPRPLERPTQRRTCEHLFLLIKLGIDQSTYSTELPP